MENLPEDQRDEDSSSPEPDPPVELLHQEQALEVIEGGVAALNIQQPLEIVQNVQPLLLRHPSVSSLDESSQKFRSTHNSLISQIQDNRPLYKNTSHPQRAFCQLNGMREDGMLTDVVLVAAGREVHIYFSDFFLCEISLSRNFFFQVRAHKALLAACSPYFYAMFSGFDETNKQRITLKDVDPIALEILVSFSK